MYLSERHLLLLPGCIFRLCLWLEYTFCIEILTIYKENEFENLKCMKNFFFSPAAVLSWLWLNTAKGSKFQTWTVDLNQIGKPLYLAVRYIRRKTREQLLPKTFFLSIWRTSSSVTKHTFLTLNPAGLGRGEMQCWQTHIKIWMGFWLVCSLVLHVFVPDMSPVRAEKPAMFANTCP